jgi:hypothetical protein
VRWLLWAAAAWLALSAGISLVTLVKLAAHPGMVIKGRSRETAAYGALAGFFIGSAIVALLVIAGLDL